MPNQLPRPAWSWRPLRCRCTCPAVSTPRHNAGTKFWRTTLQVWAEGLVAMGFGFMKLRSLVLAGAVVPLAFGSAPALVSPQLIPDDRPVILVQNATAA